MSLLDHRDSLTPFIVRETSSYLEIKCPCCSGKIKISLSNHAYGAYRCYDNHCDPKDIRKALGLLDTKNFYLSPYKQQLQQSVYADNKLIQNIEVARPIVNPSVTEYIKCDNYQPLQSSTRDFIDGSKKKTTIYPYSSHQRVYRLDSYNPPDKKQIYLQYLTEDGSWQVGNGTHTWQLYTHGLDFKASGNTVMMVEGEKTAEYVKENLNISCITAAAPCYSLDYLYKIFYVFFSKNKNVVQIIYVPDHDDPGILKANKVQKVCWYLKKSCKVISVKEFLDLDDEPVRGADLADYVLDESLLEKCKTPI